MYGWKSTLKYIKYYLKTENDYLKTLIIHPREEWVFFFLRNEKNELIWELDLKKRKKESEESVGGLLKKFRGQDGHFV